MQAVEKPAVATLSGGSSKIDQRKQEQPGPEIAPSFSVSGGNSPALTTLVRPVASSTPSAAAQEQSQLEQVQLVRAAAVIYPAIAKARNMTGMVVVQVKVGKDGKVSSPQQISGPPIFRDAAFEAALRSQFKPAKLNGQAIDQITQMKFNFH